MFYLIQPGNRRGCCVPGGARAAGRARREAAPREAAVTQAWQPGSGGPGHRGGRGRGRGWARGRGPGRGDAGAMFQRRGTWPRRSLSLSCWRRPGARAAQGRRDGALQRGRGGRPGAVAEGERHRKAGRGRVSRDAWCMCTHSAVRACPRIPYRPFLGLASFCMVMYCMIISCKRYKA